MTTLVGAAVTPRSGARDARSQDNAVAVSVIVPVSERADDLVGLYREFAAPLAAMGRAFELVFALEPWHRSHAKAVTELAAQGAPVRALVAGQALGESSLLDRKSTRLNSSHVAISYAVFCLKKKNR